MTINRTWVLARRPWGPVSTADSFVDLFRGNNKGTLLVSVA